MRHTLHSTRHKVTVGKATLNTKLRIQFFSGSLAVCLKRVCSLNRPCFDGGDSFTDRRVLLNVNRSVDSLIPDGRLIRSIDNVNLNLNCSREWRGSAILGYGLQGVRGSLCVCCEGGGVVCVREREKREKKCEFSK